MPEIINSLWIGDSLGILERLSITSFLRHGHKYHLYCYGPVANIPFGVTILDGNEILPASSIFRFERGKAKGSVASFSDLFRYKLLWEKGGWWADTDIVCLKPFGFADSIVFADEDKRWWSRQVTNAVMKLPERHVVAQICFDEASRIAVHSQTFSETGPLLLDRIVSANKLSHLVREAKIFCPIPWWKWKMTVLCKDSRRWSRYLYGGSYAVHMWHELWRRAGIDRDTPFPIGSLASHLQMKYSIE